MDEKSHIAGSRAFATHILGECCDELGYDNLVAQSARWIKEREDIIAQLRILCEEFGDNDWDETCHLGDVIDKHLGRHLLEGKHGL